MYKVTKSVNLTHPDAIRLANELAEKEDRRVHDSASRLFIKAAKRELANYRSGKVTS